MYSLTDVLNINDLVDIKDQENNMFNRMYYNIKRFLENINYKRKRIKDEVNLIMLNGNNNENITLLYIRNKEIGKIFLPLIHHPSLSVLTDKELIDVMVSSYRANNSKWSAIKDRSSFYEDNIRNGYFSVSKIHPYYLKIFNHLLINKYNISIVGDKVNNDDGIYYTNLQVIYNINFTLGKKITKILLPFKSNRTNDKNISRASGTPFTSDIRLFSNNYNFTKDRYTPTEFNEIVKNIFEFEENNSSPKELLINWIMKNGGYKHELAKLNDNIILELTTQVNTVYFS